MATTTNFGWETPDDTDLVKDGAAAIRTVANSIDTSFVDLKGGTTGQILAKASNTDLDYTWIANDTGDITGVTAGTGISGGGTSGTVTITNTVATTFDAAGDVLVGTGADTWKRLGIGTAGQVLKVNSGATDLEWGAASAGYVGVSLYNTADQNFSSSVDANVTYSNENFDTNGFHSTSTNTSRITIPSGLAGKYLVIAKIVWQANSTGYRRLYIMVNGSVVASFITNNPSASINTYQNLSWVGNLAVGDYIEVNGLQNSGSTLYVQGAPDYANNFSATYLGA